MLEIIRFIKQYKLFTSDEFSYYTWLLRGKGFDEGLTDEDIKWISEFEKKNKRLLK